MMKRIFLIAISLHIIAIPSHANPAWRHRGATRSHARQNSISSRFHHRNSSQSPSHPLSWNDVTNGFQQAVGAVRDVVTDKRIYGPLVPMMQATKEQLVAGAHKIGDLGTQVAGYLATKANDLSEALSGGVKLAMNAVADSEFSSGPKVNAWKSGFAKAREEQEQRMQEPIAPLPEPVSLPEKEITPEPSPAAEEPIKELTPEPVLEEQLPLVEPEPAVPAVPVADPLQEAVPLPEKQIALEPSSPAEEPVKESIPELVSEKKETLIVPEPVTPVVPIAAPLPESKVVVPAPRPVPSQEDTETAVFQEVVERKPLREKEEVIISPPVPPKKKKKKNLVQEQVVAEEEEYQPVRKKRRPLLEQEEDIDISKLQTEFARPAVLPSYQPTPFMNAPQQMPLYQQQGPMMMSPQPAQFVAAPVYQSNQNQLNNVAMQMQSSAMAMQMQAANLMAQAQQQQTMQPMMMQQAPLVNSIQAVPQYDSTMQQFNTPGLSKQEKTKQLMQHLYQLNELGQHNVQRLLLLVDLEIDIIEHLLAGNTGQLVELSVHERNVALKNSHQMVVAVYNMVLDQATTCGNGESDDRLYRHFVRKSKRLKQSSNAPQGKRKFLMCVLYVLERYYEIIEKMKTLTPR